MLSNKEIQTLLTASGWETMTIGKLLECAEAVLKDDISIKDIPLEDRAAIAINLIQRASAELTFVYNDLNELTIELEEAD